MWVKKGWIFNAEGQHPWMRERAMLPTALALPDRIRVFFCSRGDGNVSRIGFVDLDRDNPTQVIHLNPTPVLDVGALGAFDDSGVLPSSLVADGGKLYLYYVGYNLRTTVLHSNAIGVAVSDDQGLTFRRPYVGAVVDRNRHDPFFCISGFVLKEAGRWRMWYGSGTGWERINGKPEPLYHIKYAESADGLDWRRDNVSVITSDDPREAIVRPVVVRDGARYRMWYNHRGSLDYRDGADAYRIGYAESDDGLSWPRMDDRAGIDLSAEGWDSRMLAYHHIVDVDSRRLMFYNGNGFGLTGFGYAEWKD